MQTRKWILGAIVSIVVCGAGFVGFAAGKATSQESFPIVQPGKEHQWISTLAGEYTTKMAGMMGEEAGTSKTESILGGLWNVTHYDSKMMGQPFKGIEIFGYDTVRQKYVSVWVDSMSTSLTTLEGSYDQATKTLTMRGKSTGMDGQEAVMVNRTKFRKDGMLFEMSMEGEGGPMMAIDYNRTNALSK